MPPTLQDIDTAVRDAWVSYQRRALAGDPSAARTLEWIDKQLDLRNELTKVTA